MTLVLDPLLVLVDEQDCQVGMASKSQVHALGLLHRAFSVFIFNERGELLLQKRSLKKYHSGGLWSNTCCGHPNPGERVKDAAERRLFEEMGFTVPLHYLFTFSYRAELANGLIENEVDHVFTGNYSSSIMYNVDEVMDSRFSSLEELDTLADPQAYSPWFHLAYPRVREYIKEGRGGS